MKLAAVLTEVGLFQIALPGQGDHVEAIQSIEGLERRAAELFLLAALLRRSISSKVAQNFRLQ